MTSKTVAQKHAFLAIEAIDNDQQVTAENHLTLSLAAVQGEKEMYRTLLSGYAEINYLAEWES